MLVVFGVRHASNFKEYIRINESLGPVKHDISFYGYKEIDNRRNSKFAESQSWVSKTTPQLHKFSRILVRSLNLRIQSQDTGHSFAAFLVPYRLQGWSKHRLRSRTRVRE